MIEKNEIGWKKEDRDGSVDIKEKKKLCQVVMGKKMQKEILHNNLKKQIWDVWILRDKDVS